MVFVQATNTQARKVPRVLDELCQACNKCVARKVCRTKALLQIDPGEPPVVEPSLCYGCHQCVALCPVGAIMVNESPAPK